MSLFDPDIVYPSDSEGGRYVELGGLVSHVGTLDLGDQQLLEIEITVQTKHGEQRGWWRTPRSSTFRAELGMWATIRVYDGGELGMWAAIRVYDGDGGWYPDNRITNLERVA